MPTPEHRLDPSLPHFTQTLQIAPDGSVSAIEACPETVHASPSDSAAGAVLGGASLGDQWRAAGGRSGNLPQGERYQTGEVLGIGASGRVFAVTDRNLERTVAAKLLSDAEGDVDRSEKFLREARLMARLDHPNVIPIYDAAIAPNGQPYFTMKTIAGVTLGEAIRQVESGIAAPRIATPSDVARIVVDVCKAVSYAHHRGVIHQDIKPDNIMMGEFGEVLLLDWGSALCVAPDGTVEGQSYGTPLYMSPEQARGERASRQSDIYCLGATFFHALVGRLPTWADDPDVFWTRKRAGTITPPTAAERRRVPPALLGIALKASAADNAQRYASVDALLADLQRWQSGLTIDAYRESLLQFLGRWSVRNRRSLLVACAMLALIILAGGLWYESWRKEQVSWTLAMQEDFAGPIDRIANDWQPNYTCINLAIPEPYSDVPLGKSHSWYMGDGGLETDAGVDDINLTCKRVFPANVRIEWDYLDRSGTTNLNCYFGSNRSAGYTFHVAGWNNDRSVVLTRGASYARLDWSIIKAMTQGVPHHFIMERADGHYRLSIDGDQVIDFQVIGGMDSPDAPTFGFDSFMNALTVRNVRVYTQRPPQLVSPLAVADAFYSAQHFNEALQQYSTIAASYPDSDLAIKAQFGIALCLSRSKKTAAAAAALDEFSRQHRGDPLEPFALVERVHIAELQNDRPTETNLMQQMTRFAGHPVMHALIAEFSEDRCKVLNHDPVRTIEDVAYTREHLQLIQDAILELERWSRLYGVDCSLMRLRLDGCRTLMPHGHSSFVAAHSPIAIDRLSALYNQGAFDQVISDPAATPALLNRTYIAERRYDKLVPLPGQEGEVEREDYLHLGADCYRTYNGTETADQRAMRAKYHDQEMHSTNWIMTMQGDKYGIRPFALLALHRDQEVVSQYPGKSAMLYGVAFHKLADGDEAGFWAMTDALAKRPFDSEEDYAEFIIRFGFGAAKYLLPLVRTLDRDGSVDPRPALAPFMDEMKENSVRQVWYTAAYLRGDIDERAFLGQPVKQWIEARQAFTKGLLAEIRHQPAEAKAAYALVPADLSEPRIVGTFAAWRMRRLEGRLP